METLIRLDQRGPYTVTLATTRVKLTHRVNPANNLALGKHAALEKPFYGVHSRCYSESVAS